MGVKLNPSTYVQGGLLNDVDVELKEVRWTTFDFQGTADKPVLAARCIFTVIDGDGEEHEQFLSAGSLERFIPDDDTEGKCLKQVGTAERMTKGTNWDLFISSVADKGGDLTPLDEDISVLDSSKFHIIRIPAPKRSGGNIHRRSEREAEVLVVDKVINLPWDKKGGAKSKTTAAAAAKSKTKPAAPAPAAAEETDDTDVMTVINTLSTVLSEGSYSIARVKVLAFREFSKDKSLLAKRNALSGMITEEFLTENGFTVDGDTVSMS